MHVPCTSTARLEAAWQLGWSHSTKTSPSARLPSSAAYPALTLPTRPQHVSIINKRLPDGPCRKCGSTGEWKDAGAKRCSAAPTPAADFLPRGEEHGRFRNSAPLPSHAVDVGSSSAAPPQARCDHNAWQSSLPVFDQEE